MLRFLSKKFFITRTRTSDKIFKSSLEAIQDMQPGMRILCGGFGVSGSPINLINAIDSRSDLKDLEIVSNNCGIDEHSLGILLHHNKIKRMVSSFIGGNREFETKYLTGDLELELIPQGTLAEKMRCGGAGIPAFYTPTGVGTNVEYGGIIIRAAKDGQPEILSKPKEVKEFNGRKYVMEESITGDFAIVKAYKADTLGNLVFRKTARNFNPDAASAAKITIAEVEEIVEAGELDPEEIHLPGIYVHRIVKGEFLDKRIEKIKLFGEDQDSDVKRIKIARRAAREIRDGMYVNLGIGIPTLVPNYVDSNIKIQIHTENGMLGVGPYPKKGHHDADLINAGKETVSETKGCVYFKSSDSFGMVRGRHVDLTLLGGLQVSKEGDLANWMIPGKKATGMGGAMDLVGSGGPVVVVMEHVAKDKKGNISKKIFNECSFPLTGKRVVSKLITDLCVFEFRNGDGITLVELFEGETVDKIKSMTDCDFKIANDLKTIKFI